VTLPHESLVAQIQKGKTAPFYLFWGEEFLIRQSSDAVVKALVPDASIGLNLSILDGASPRDVANDLATLPLFPGRKVVLVRDPEFVAPKKGRGDPLVKPKEAWVAGKRKEAARRILALAARAGWGVSELDPTRSGSPSPEAWAEELDVQLAPADVEFLKEVAQFCVEEGIKTPEADATALLELLEKGLFPDQILVIVASVVDSKNPLLKWAQKQGVVVEQKAPDRQKDVDIGELAQQTLKPFGKTLASDAATLLKDKCGGNMRLVQSELEKLALYTNQPRIVAQDVELLVEHAREDEFLELSDALQKRDLKAALAYVTHAVEMEKHPLMILGAVSSNVRTLIENHERLERYAGGKAPRSMDEFKRTVFPRIDADAKADGGRSPNPWAAFFAMQGAARYSRSELLNALVACADADLALKSSAVKEGMVLVQRVLWTLCLPASAGAKETRPMMGR